MSAAPGERDDLLTVEVIEDGEAGLLVKVHGELDMSNVDELAEEVDRALSNRQTKLVIDARDLRFVDSSGIALWVRWSSRVEGFELRHPSPLLTRVIEAMGLGAKLGVQR
jgi:anti-anti-sigma factor